MPGLPIHVDRDLVLRRPEVDDSDALFDLLDSNRDHLSRWDGPWLDRIKTPADQRTAIEGYLRPGAEDSELYLLILHRGKLVGTISLRGLGSTDRRGYIGFGLAEWAQGLGIMTRSLRALIGYAFSEKRMKRLTAYAAVDNRRSRSVALRAGFTLDGIERGSLLVRGKYLDRAAYSIRELEWRRREAKSTRIGGAAGGAQEGR